MEYLYNTIVYGDGEVAQSCPTLRDPVACSPPGSSVHRILQARIPGWIAISFSKRAFPTQGLNPHPLWLLNWQAGSATEPGGKPSWR